MDRKQKHLLFRHFNGRQAGLGAQCIVVDNNSLKEANMWIERRRALLYASLLPLFEHYVGIG